MRWVTNAPTPSDPRCTAGGTQAALVTMAAMATRRSGGHGARDMQGGMKTMI
ncbi:MAG: hypothetical protein HY944_06565 [Gemmatimonadetes bacterium]|nr:hypothetical protein [Gemmatimonadota bacterium]